MIYKKIKEKYIDEIDSNVVIYEHVKTHAKICTMKNEDDNKVFSIAFRTPPINSTGLTHILEHSVLCGSKNYPVKDPFVELIKGSLNTFINAFTFADKTMYPVASKNIKDFRNLVHVYLDAVFYPNIYNHEEIFMQEGWHYEIKDEKDPIIYNGVVYNEMKGAFSDPTQILYRSVTHSLFPDNAYGFESGGDPKYIPDLTYDEFINFHKKYYSPSNSYIFLYGNLDMESELKWIDEEYLSAFDYVEFDTEIKNQAPFKKPIYVEEKYEVTGDLKDKAYLSYNVVFPSTLDTKLMIASQVLLTALFDVTGAPLKEALIKANIAKAIDTFFDEEIKMPVLSINASGANIENQDKFIKTIDDELNNILAKGLDKETILSILNHAEFENREKNFSARMPKGLSIQIASLASWLYDDNSEFSKLEILKYYDELKEDLKGDYFENIIRKYILNNNHKSYVSLVPTFDSNSKDKLELENKLKAYKDSLSKDELKKLIDKNIALSEYQSKADTKENLDKLPKLTIDDIKAKPEEFKLEVIKDKYDILFSNYHTNDIIYLEYMFDISHMNSKDIKYISLFTDLFRDFNTTKHSYFELNKLIRNNLGAMSAFVTNYSKKGESKLALLFSVSALNKNVGIMEDLFNEAIFDNKFEYERIKEKISEFKTTLSTSIVGKGHSVALTRALSFINEDSYYKDLMSGVEYIKFITDLNDNFDERFEEIKSKLENIKSFLTKRNFTLSVTGSKEDLEKAKAIASNLYDKLPDSNDYEKLVFKPTYKREAIKTNFNVNFVAVGALNKYDFNSKAYVLQNTMSMDYLWDRVRVHGGAYGCMMLYTKNKTLGFTSYRDPNLDYTYDVYLKAPEFIKNINPSDEDLLKFKIGAIGSSQLVLHPKDMAKTAKMLYNQGITYEDRLNDRVNLVNCTKKDLVSFEKVYSDSFKEHTLCVLGNEKEIEKSKIKFDSIIDL
ncbi:MAG: insulinase family protein [Acholeplasmatales bacterium]|nr:insulinase family protein [Acholeplasmatales bacterium]